MTMGGPIVVTTWVLTGTARHRRNWRGKMILQIQESRQEGRATPFKPQLYDLTQYRWRDAGARDLARLERLFGSRINLVGTDQ